ncbi:MAG: class I SAM-dependent methyltransferase [Flavobacterium sp.]|nr:class I SAM-dependent methyltransferase [Flavobacterium sp.]
MNQIQPAATVFNHCAADYERQFMDVSLYSHSFDLFCTAVKEKATVLEIGCGPGNITKYLLEKRPDLNLFGIDVAPNMIELAKNNNPNAHFAVMDALEISKIDKQFDAIVCGFCLPYLAKEATIQLIADAALLLNENGILYLSTMEDDYKKSRLQTSSNGKHTLFMYFHEAAYLKEALLENGFEIISQQYQDYPTKDGSKVVDLILIAQKK